MKYKIFGMMMFTILFAVGISAQVQESSASVVSCAGDSGVRGRANGGEGVKGRDGGVGAHGRNRSGGDNGTIGPGPTLGILIWDPILFPEKTRPIRFLKLKEEAV